MQYEGEQDIDVIGEYDKMVEVKKIESRPDGSGDTSEEQLEPVPPPEQAPEQIQKIVEKTKKVKKPEIFKKTSKLMSRSNLEKSKKLERLPEIEPSDGFTGRRPNVDPYKVGERVELSISYFNVSAGTLVLETLPFVEVNGQKAYHFVLRLKSSKMFSMVYSVDDWAETFLDYNEMLPHTFQLHVKETKQLKEVRTFFDRSKNKGHYWERKVSEDDGEKKIKKVWDIPDYAQNT
ncbi:MAG: DUF3108 domain-containing protein, partial [Bdellovibrionales bacterium]|nr:DUF3108 domain-containing protein [Bdellovibrionales bacterium]